MLKDARIWREIGWKLLAAYKVYCLDFWIFRYVGKCTVFDSGCGNEITYLHKITEYASAGDSQKMYESAECNFIC